jgi:hypothetical protein
MKQAHIAVNYFRGMFSADSTTNLLRGVIVTAAAAIVQVVLKRRAI